MPRFSRIKKDLSCVFVPHVMCILIYHSDKCVIAVSDASLQTIPSVTVFYLIRVLVKLYSTSLNVIFSIVWKYWIYKLLLTRLVLNSCQLIFRWFA